MVGDGLFGRWFRHTSSAENPAYDCWSPTLTNNYTQKTNMLPYRRCHFKRIVWSSNHFFSWDLLVFFFRRWVLIDWWKYRSLGLIFGRLQHALWGIIAELIVFTYFTISWPGVSQLPSWKRSHIPSQGTCEDDFPFSMVEYMMYHDMLVPSCKFCLVVSSHGKKRCISPHVTKSTCWQVVCHWIFQYFRRFHVWAGIIHGHQWVSSTIWDLKDELNVLNCTNI